VKQRWPVFAVAIDGPARRFAQLAKSDAHPGGSFALLASGPTHRARRFDGRAVWQDEEQSEHGADG
jgi:hypothetical protein